MASTDWLDPNSTTDPATGKPWVQPPTSLQAGTPWGNAGASPLTNMGYFTNEPGILGRSLMTGMNGAMNPGGQGSYPYAGNVYGQDPFSQYLQNRYQAAGTLGTYLAPANDYNGMTQYMNASQYPNAINDPMAQGGIMDRIRALLPYMDKFKTGDVSGMFSGDNAAQATSALSLWKDPQADMRLLQSALAGLPTPLGNSLGSMASTIFNMFQDKLPGLPDGTSFLKWLMG